MERYSKLIKLALTVNTLVHLLILAGSFALRPMVFADITPTGFLYWTFTSIWFALPAVIVISLVATWCFYGYKKARHAFISSFVPYAFLILLGLLGLLI